MICWPTHATICDTLIFEPIHICIYRKGGRQKTISFLAGSILFIPRLSENTFRAAHRHNQRRVVSAEFGHANLAHIIAHFTEYTGYFGLSIIHFVDRVVNTDVNRADRYEHPIEHIERSRY